MGKFPWDKIRAEYIEAPDEASRPTLQQLADKFGVSFGYIQQVAAKEGWTEQSKIFLRKIEEERRQHKSSSLASEQAQFDADCLKLGRAVMANLAAHLRACHDAKIPVKLSELDSLTRSLERVQKIGRLALGEQTDTESSVVNIQVEQDRLTLMPAEELQKLYREMLR